MPAFSACPTFAFLHRLTFWALSVSSLFLIVKHSVFVLLSGLLAFFTYHILIRVLCRNLWLIGLRLFHRILLWIRLSSWVIVRRVRLLPFLLSSFLFSILSLISTFTTFPTAFILTWVKRWAALTRPYHIWRLFLDRIFDMWSLGFWILVLMFFVLLVNFRPF